MKGMFLFQRDLRITDQVGLTTALMNCDEILLAAVFDPENHKLSVKDIIPEPCFNLIERLSALIALENTLSENQIPIAIHIGPMVTWVLEICEKHEIETIWLNKVNEPKFLNTYKHLEKVLSEKGIALICCDDDYSVPYEKVKKEDGSVYKVFTPFYKKWRSLLNLEELSPYIPEWQSSKSYITVENKFSTWDEAKKAILQLKEESPLKNEKDYQNQWASFLTEKMESYDHDRDFPAIEGTSQMSIGLNNGLVSYRQLVREAYLHPKGEAFLRQLAWRQFYQMILVNFPEVETDAFRREYRQMKWPNDPELFQKWKAGETGFPIVDGAMKQLKVEGIMHNRLRMVCASLLVKHLGVDWRWGEAYFYEMLRDGDLALNNGGWQWCASTGTDAQPYFRIFNPLRQAERYDPKSIYVNRWVESYSEPCVDLKFMSNWTIQHYKKAKGGASEDE